VGFEFAVDLASPLAQGFHIGLQQQAQDVRAQREADRMMFESERVANARAQLGEQARYHDMTAAYRDSNINLKYEAMQAKEDAKRAQAEAEADTMEQTGGFGTTDPSGMGPTYGGIGMSRDQFMSLPPHERSRHSQAWDKQRMREAADASADESIRAALVSKYGPDDVEKIMGQVKAQRQAARGGLSQGIASGLTGLMSPADAARAHKYDEPSPEEIAGLRLLHPETLKDDNVAAAYIRGRRGGYVNQLPAPSAGSDKITASDRILLADAQRQVEDAFSYYKALSARQDTAPETLAHAQQQVEDRRASLAAMVQALTKGRPGVLPGFVPPKPAAPASPQAASSAGPVGAFSRLAGGAADLWNGMGGFGARGETIQSPTGTLPSPPPGAFPSPWGNDQPPAKPTAVPGTQVYRKGTGASARPPQDGRISSHPITNTVPSQDGVHMTPEVAAAASKMGLSFEQLKMIQSLKAQGVPSDQIAARIRQMQQQTQTAPTTEYDGHMDEGR